MQGPLVVALVAPARSGKDSAATGLRCLGFNNVKIASRLKAACREAFDFTDDQLESDLKDAVDPRFGVTPRRAMQWLGTEVFQHMLPGLLLGAAGAPAIGRKHWVRMLADEMQAFNDVAMCFVVTDLRYPHEHEELKERFGLNLLTVRIERPGVGRADTHCSETSHADIQADAVIVNDGSVDDLHEKINAVCAPWVHSRSTNLPLGLNSAIDRNGA